MLALRPVCENCKKTLPPNSIDAMICSFECTFCKACVETVLENVCPNCGGGFCPRPIRPANNLKNDNYIGKYPASEKIIYKPVDVAKHKQFAESIKTIAAHLR